MLHTGIIFLLPFMLASVSFTQGLTIPNFFLPSNGNDDRDTPQPSDFYDLPLPGRDEWSLFEHRDNQPKSTEDRYSVKTAAFASLSKQPAVMELLYDLKVLACSSAIPPSSGRMVSYETWVHENDQGAIRCWSRRASFGNIPTEKETKHQESTIYTLESENFGEDSYHPRRLQYFNVTCPGHGEIRSMTTNLEGEASLTVANKMHRFCVDYVHVMYEDVGTSCQLCGNETVKDKSCARDFNGSILVTFRTSLENQFRGFKMTVACFKKASGQNLPGCIQSLPAEEAKAKTNNEDSHSYYKATQKFLPANAKEQLTTFYKSNVNTASTFSAESNYEMLRLALLSQNSCNAVLRALGRGVSQMFPPHMVLQAKINGWEYV